MASLQQHSCTEHTPATRLNPCGEAQDAEKVNFHSLARVYCSQNFGQSLARARVMVGKSSCGVPYFPVLSATAFRGCKRHQTR